MMGLGSHFMLCHKSRMEHPNRIRHRGVAQLPILGKETAACVTALAGVDWRLGPRAEAVAGDLVEALCHVVAGRLRSDGLSDAEGDWLLDHGPSVQSRVETPELRRMSVMLE